MLISGWYWYRLMFKAETGSEMSSGQLQSACVQMGGAQREKKESLPEEVAGGAWITFV